MCQNPSVRNNSVIFKFWWSHQTALREAASELVSIFSFYSAPLGFVFFSVCALYTFMYMYVMHIDLYVIYMYILIYIKCNQEPYSSFSVILKGIFPFLSVTTVTEHWPNTINFFWNLFQIRVYSWKRNDCCSSLCLPWTIFEVTVMNFT